MPEGPQGKVFINYRRSDDPGAAGWLYTLLEQQFGKDNLFMDVEGHIKSGDDFVAVLEEWVTKCDVLLAVIGKAWLDMPDAGGGRRLDNPDDFVRIEIASALHQGKRVIPVLVNGAAMPSAAQLPEPLKPLARRNAVRLTHERFAADVHGLTKQIEEFLAEAAAARAVRTEAERQEAAEARRAREAEEAARAERRAAEEAAGRAAGLTPEEIWKAEELANWEFVKERQNVADLRDHLARFAGGSTERYARAKLEALVWADPATQSGIVALHNFQSEFPNGDHVTVAKARLAALVHEQEVARQAERRSYAEMEAWTRIADSTQAIEVEAFLKAWPSGEHAVAAKARIREIRDIWKRREMLGMVGAGAVALIVFSLIPGVTIWHVSRGTGRAIRVCRHAGPVTSVVFSPDGSTTLSGSSDNALRLWDVATGRELRTFLGHTSSVNAVAFSPDGQIALSSSWDKMLKLWDVPTGKELRNLTGHSGWVPSITFSPNGRTALSGSTDRTLKLWDVATGTELRTFSGHTDSVRSVAVSLDGRTALSGSDDKMLKLWEVATGRELRTFAGHTGSILSAVFSPNDRTALSGSFDHTVRLWEVVTGRELRTFLGHTRPVNTVAFSPNGRTALSGSEDKTLKLWDVATGKELSTFSGHTDWVHSVAFSPDGRTALSGSADNTLRLWDLSPYLPPRA